MPGSRPTSWPGLSRPSTSCFDCRIDEPKGVDARHKAGHDELEMTIAVSESAPRLTHGFDFTKLVLYGFALALCLLIVLPMSWLVYYGFTDKDGAFTLQNFVTLVNDPTLLDPFDHHLHPAPSAPA